MLTGDFLFARAAKLAAETDYLPLMKLFADTLATIVNGELTQMFSARGVIDRNNYYNRIYAKTASLFEMSAMAATMVATEDEETRQAMKTYGYEVGMAFQIVDDILDFTGDEAQMGKPVGSDLREGTITLPGLLLLERYPQDNPIKKFILAKTKREERLQEAIAMVRSTEVLGVSMDMARDYVRRGNEALSVLPD